jgi:hypothetical protein
MEFDLLHWNNNYKPLNQVFIDGSSWSMIIKMQGITICKSGTNAFPDQWKEWCKLLAEITGIKGETWD